MTESSDALMPKVGSAETVVEKETFVRGLKLLDVMTLVVGMMIGSGIFIVSAETSRILQSPGLLLVVWAIAGFLTVAGALSYGELTAAMPKAGGQYVFLREAFGPLTAFLYGWSFFLVMCTGVIAAVAVAFSKFLGVFLPWVSASNIIFQAGFIKISTQQTVAMFVIIFLTYVNSKGVKEGAIVQNIFTILKVFAVILLLLAGLTIGRNNVSIQANFTNMFSGIPHSFGLLTLIGSAMVGALFSMDAWAFVCATAAEVENPKKNLPLALFYGTGFVALLYFVVNLAYMSVLPMFGDPNGADIVARGIQYASEERVATAVAQTMLGSTGLYLIAGAIMISTFGCVNGTILTGARLYYAMAKDGLFFKSVSKINPKTHVPTTALVVGAIWASILTLTGSYGQLLDYIITVALVFYSLTILGLLVLRKKRPDMERPYKAWGYPWLQIVYIIGAMSIFVDLLIFKPSYAWPGFIIVLAGVPVYYIWRWRSKAA